MTTPRRHHYLPRFYQASWCVDGQFFVHDRRTGKIRRASPPDTAVVHDYYRVVYGSGRADVQVERILSLVEDKAKECIRLLNRGNGVSQTQRYELSQFVALLHTRVPSFMDRFDRRAEESLRKRIVDALPNEAAAAKWLASQGDVPARLKKFTPKQLLSALRGDGCRIRVPAAYRIAAALQAGMALAGEIVGRHWCVLRTPEHIKLITSDSPVVIGVEWNPVLPIGVTVHQVALSPTLLLRTGLPGSSIRHGHATEAQVKQHNKAMMADAQHLVLASSKDAFSAYAV